jgi:hypothetical protein
MLMQNTVRAAEQLTHIEMPISNLNPSIP